MALLPTLQNISNTVSTVSRNVSEALPIFTSQVQAAVDTVSTAVKGKQPAPSVSQEPATVSELVPRNVGGLSLDFAKGSMGGFLILAVVAGLVIMFYGTKRR